MRARNLSMVAFAMAVALAAAACGSGSGTAGHDTSGTGGHRPVGDVTVFAAASLTEAFTDIGNAFEADHVASAVTMNFAGSSELVTQIVDGGAPADVFASADPTNMARLTDAGAAAAADPVTFADNALEIIVESGNPKHIIGVADLARDDLVVVTCAAEVPCGIYARQLFDNADVTVTPRSLEENVKAVVTKVVLGEADAGIVYRTDVAAAGEAAEGVRIPAALNLLAAYPIVALDDAPDPDGAAAFIDFVLSDAGRSILESYGFTAP